jgi:hypothetical protein
MAEAGTSIEKGNEIDIRPAPRSTFVHYATCSICKREDQDHPETFEPCTLKGAEYQKPRDLAVVFVACKTNPKCIASAQASLSAIVARVGLPFHSDYFPKMDDKQNNGWTWKPTNAKEPEHNFKVSALHWSISRDCPVIRMENDHYECYVRWNDFLALNKEKLLAFNKSFSSSSAITFPPHYPSLQTQQTNEIWKLWLSATLFLSKHEK